MGATPTALSVCKCRAGTGPFLPQADETSLSPAWTVACAWPSASPDQRRASRNIPTMLPFVNAMSPSIGGPRRNLLRRRGLRHVAERQRPEPRNQHAERAAGQRDPCRGQLAGSPARRCRTTCHRGQPGTRPCALRRRAPATGDDTTTPLGARPVPRRLAGAQQGDSGVAGPGRPSELDRRSFARSVGLAGAPSREPAEAPHGFAPRRALGQSFVAEGQRVHSLAFRTPTERRSTAAATATSASARGTASSPGPPPSGSPGSSGVADGRVGAHFAPGQHRQSSASPRSPTQLARPGEISPPPARLRARQVLYFHVPPLRVPTHVLWPG